MRVQTVAEPNSSLSIKIEMLKPSLRGLLCATQQQQRCLKAASLVLGLDVGQPASLLSCCS